MQYVGLCVFSLPISLVMIERIYILCLIIIIKSEVWIITHCLGLGHETMVCAVCLFVFLLIEGCSRSVKYEFFKSHLMTHSTILTRIKNLDTICAILNIIAFVGHLPWDTIINLDWPGGHLTALGSTRVIYHRLLALLERSTDCTGETLQYNSRSSLGYHIEYMQRIVHSVLAVEYRFCTGRFTGLTRLLSEESVGNYTYLIGLITAGPNKIIAVRWDIVLAFLIFYYVRGHTS